MKLCQRLTGSLAAASLLLTLTACTSLPAPGPEETKVASSERQQPIYVIGHGWHTGVVVPGATLNQAVPQLRERFGDPAYYEVGWGDAAFYQSEEASVGLALQALFLSKGAVVHVVSVPDVPPRYFTKEKVLATCISEPELATLTKHISESFERDASGKLVAQEAGHYGDSQFYAATGHYSLVNTCNTWTSRSLASAGMEVSPHFKQTAGPVLRYLQTHRETCPAAEQGK
jgi:uncharacterized protein (TIGR02117 family)